MPQGKAKRSKPARPVAREVFTGEIPQTPQRLERLERLILADREPARHLARLAPHLPVPLRRYGVTSLDDASLPGRELPRIEWIKLWRSIGFSIGTERASRPRSPLRLYRAAVPGWERGFSWTENRALAEWFQWLSPDWSGRRRYRGPDSANPMESTDARIYTTLAPPSALLGGYMAVCTNRATGVTKLARAELVVDAARLPISEVTSAAA